MAEVKVINPPPISCEIYDLDGKKYVATAKLRVTKKNIDELGAIFDEAAKLPPNRVQAFQMLKLYSVPGIEKESDYDNFEIRVLKAAVSHFTTSNANPTMTAGGF